MKLLAISGGVDSMLLAHKYKDKKVVVAFVNYNIRKDTHKDEKIVEDFCKKNKIKLEKLILDGMVPNNNFENWARELRYNFFKKIYQKYNCSQLLIAHHKDDFLETCIMQKEKNKEKLYYGIKKSISFKGMKIYRPFLFKYWKEQIYELARINKINYNEDYTNNDIQYKRNEIRKKLSDLSINEKEKMLNDFLKINYKNEEIIKCIKFEYKKWRESKFNTKSFFEFSKKEELIKLFINKRVSGINLNKNIIKNIINFIQKKDNNKSFLLTNGNFLYKKNNKVFIKKI